MLIISFDHFRGLVQVILKIKMKMYIQNVRQYLLGYVLFNQPAVVFFLVFSFLLHKGTLLDNIIIVMRKRYDNHNRNINNNT